LPRQEHLEEVVKLSRNKDKRIHREACDKLAALQEAIARPLHIRQQRQALCARLSKLANSQDFEQASKEYLLLEQHWQALSQEPISNDEDLFEQFTSTYQTFKRNLEQHQAEQALFAQQCQQKDQLLADIAGELARLAAHPNTDAEQDTSCEVWLSEQELRWTQIGTLPAQAHDYQARWVEQCQAMRQTLQMQRQYRQISHQGEAICRDMQHLLDSKKPIREKQLEQFTQRWQALQQPPQADFSALNSRYATLTQSLRALREAQKLARKNAVQELKTVLDELENKLEAGVLHEAVPLEKQAQELFANLVDIPRAQYHPLEQRMHAIDAKYRELRGWQQWGNDLEREKLCAEIEALIGAEVSPELLAKQIQEAQKQWKELSHAAGDRSNQTLWKRFQNACNRAYEPCKQYFQQLADARHQHHEQKALICQELEQFTHNTDWQGEVDWKAVYRFSQTSLKAWHATGPVDRKEKKNLNHRFDAAMAALNKNLEGERTQNKAMRKGLIEQAQALQNIEDLRKAIDEAKRLQAAWKITVPGTRREEKELWEKFRSLCDQVFQRHKAEKNSVVQESNANLEAKMQLCAKLEQLATSTEEALIKTLPAMRAKAQSEWQAIGQVPKKKQHEIEKRFEEACAGLVTAVNNLRLRQARHSLEALRAKGRICAELEYAVEHGAHCQESLAHAHQAWEALPPLHDAEMEKGINARFAAACAAANNKHWPTGVLEKGRKIRELLCIRMELAAGIESPPHARQARMEYQVQRLSQAMAGEKSAIRDTPEKLEKEWFIAAASTELSALESRFQTALEAYHTGKSS